MSGGVLGPADTVMTKMDALWKTCTEQSHREKISHGRHPRDRFRPGDLEPPLRAESPSPPAGRGHWTFPRLCPQPPLRLLTPCVVPVPECRCSFSLTWPCRVCQFLFTNGSHQVYLILYTTVTVQIRQSYKKICLL